MRQLFSRAVFLVWPVLVFVYWNLLEGRNSVLSRSAALQIEIILFSFSSIVGFFFACSTQSRKGTIGYVLVVILLCLLVTKSIERRVVTNAALRTERQMVKP
jgi:RsiW-degrading membrane proteinase PrsW (M82 family)